MGKVELIKSYSEKEVDLIRPIVEKIEHLRVMTAMMSDETIRNKRYEFKERLDNGETLDDLMVEAFAVVREATARVRHTPHYPCQLMGGIILHQGRVAQMCTGEGKTQTCILPAYLNALDGKGVHVVTCNDYLSARDAEDLRPVYEFLGMTVGSIKKDTETDARRAAYACDITYVTNSDLAFDYLRDNMAISKDKQVLRDLHYCIVDEVDEVLIDQAKMPLRISSKVESDESLYLPANEFVLTLTLGEEAEQRSKIDYFFGVEAEDTGDYIIDEKNNRVNLTNAGIEKAEKFFKIDNLAEPEYMELRHHINNALRANYLMTRDDDYMVSEGKVLLIDKFTGRAIPGCKFSNGLHEALEAKEGLKISRATITIANVTYQSFFNKYDKKGGLTGTGQTEELEFRTVYGMDVIVIPTNRPIQRIDKPDAVYRTKKEKLNAVVDEVRVAAEKKQPVLIGTPSVEASEEVSKLLETAGIKHELLNAKRLDQEAEIVSRAGQIGAITVATNMAGRGTDIKINPESRAVGGLKVIATEHFESRRIDDQLRGRSGRQGDVGESQFIVSLEDELLVNFGSEKLQAMCEKLKFPEGHKIENKAMTRAIDNAQRTVEHNNFGARQNTFDYDKVLNEQREIIYEERERILTHDNIHPTVCRLIEHVINDAVDRAIGDVKFAKWDYEDLNNLILPIIPLKPLSQERMEYRDNLGLRIQLKYEALTLYEDKLQVYGQTQNMAEIEKVVLLKSIDTKWTRHIDDMDQLRQWIHLESYSGKKPIDQFIMYAYDMFDDMISDIREDAIYILYNAKFGKEIDLEQVAKIVGKIDTDARKSANAAQNITNQPIVDATKVSQAAKKKAIEKIVEEDLAAPPVESALLLQRGSCRDAIVTRKIVKSKEQELGIRKPVDRTKIMELAGITQKDIELEAAMLEASLSAKKNQPETVPKPEPKSEPKPEPIPKPIPKPELKPEAKSKPKPNLDIKPLPSLKAEDYDDEERVLTVSEVLKNSDSYKNKQPAMPTKTEKVGTTKPAGDVLYTNRVLGQVRGNTRKLKKN